MTRGARTPRALAAAGVWLAAAAAGQAAQAPCAADSPCAVTDGYYLARPPAGWDGRSTLPAVLFFHGYRGRAEETLANEELRRFADAAGLLLVAPAGRDMTWSFNGSPSHSRDDLAYVRSVLDDLPGRYPVDARRLWASGFSVGGSMVWHLACNLGDRFVAFAPVAGAFWEPIPTGCPTGPVDLYHVHGAADPVVPIAGRQLRGGARQGNLFAGVETLKKLDRCEAARPTTVREDDLSCEVWRGCASGRELRICLHAGEHEINGRWLAGAWAWVEKIAARNAAKARN